MDFNMRHPLNAITNSQNLSMLEALIPYVDYPLKLPLALLIKYYEIQQIMQAFQSIENLSRYGLHNVSNDPMEMIGAMTGISPELIRMMLSENMPQPNNNSFDQNIQSIFSEYDDFIKKGENHDF